MAIPNASPSDDHLAAGIINHDPQAFELLFERYYAAITRHLESMVHNEPAAQDLLQEVFLLVWQRAGQWSGQGSFKAWLYRIATNQALNWLRAQKRRPEQPLMMPDEGAWDDWSDDPEPPLPGWLVDRSNVGPANEMERLERRRRLVSIIADLPEEKREVFRLVHEMELSIRDTAGRLGIPEGTVKSRLHYAQKKLSQVWQDWETEL